jgi:hypothetical protein
MRCNAHNLSVCACITPAAGLVELIIAIGADKPASPPIVITIAMISWGIAVAYRYGGGVLLLFVLMIVRCSAYLLMLVRKEYNVSNTCVSDVSC